MRTLKGTVVSDKMQKTRVVAVVRSVKHPRYGKYIQLTTRLKAHDAENKYKTGDEVIIRETRPLSKDKRWEIVELVTEDGATNDQRHSRESGNPEKEDNTLDSGSSPE